MGGGHSPPTSTGFTSAAEGLLESVDQGCLRRLDPPPSLDRPEPSDAVDLGKALAAARSRRPLDLDRVRVCVGWIQVAFHRPGVDDLAALLDDRSQLDGG